MIVNSLVKKAMSDQVFRKLKSAKRSQIRKREEDLQSASSSDNNDNATEEAASENSAGIRRRKQKRQRHMIQSVSWSIIDNYFSFI